MIIPMLILLFIMLCFPSVCISGAKEGLLLWFNTVLPSIFPFLIITTYINFHMKSSKSSALLLFCGLLGGLPIGAKVTSDLVQNGSIPIKSGTFLFPVLNIASPSFIFGYVSASLFGSASFGIKLFIVVLLSGILASSLLYLLCSLFRVSFTQRNSDAAHFAGSSINKATPADTTSDLNQHADISTSHVHSIQNDVSFDFAVMSSVSIISKIGGYIILFSMANMLLSHVMRDFPAYNNTPLSACIASVLEITTGTKLLFSSVFYENIKKALIAAFISFGGLSGLAQTYSVSKASGLSISYYVISKLLSAFIAFCWMYLIV